ncbi:winged helix-turn-helix domain-containing protein [Rhizobium sp. SGZ-381]|uniref:winged helix-turn-helix domain-containing protein n=1 Tax=Rhizobium sp. SGZ-381 TaxID=3342800 RepID=UPI0036709275
MEMVVLMFGRYLIDRERRCLVNGHDVISLGGRAFDVLVALVEAKGAIVTKDALIDRVWEGRIVNDNAIEAQIHALRRSLGSDRNLIKTVAGKGYCLVELEAPRLPPPSNLKSDLSSLVARDDLQADICTALSQHRLVTLIGPGGIGKSRLSRVAAAALRDGFPDGIWMVELAPVDNERFVSPAIAGALGISSSDPSDLRSLMQAISGKTCLLVLDNCEHLLDAVAATALDLLSGCPGVRILATSREALQIDGERIIRIPALALPRNHQPLQEILTSPAVQLFTQRFVTGSGSLALQRDLSPLVEICRQVDGIPLAIEMAAAAARTLGVTQVLNELRTSLSILGVSRRSTEPRQQTMEATIEWSYRLLSLPEQMVFRSLSLLSGGFATEAAVAIAAMPRAKLVNILSSLVSKSLLTVATTEQGTLFHQLEPMRQYARARLDETGEYATVAARHAGLMLGIFQRADAELDKLLTAQWIERYKPYLPGLRQALEWSFGEGNDPYTGVRLVVAAEPLWLHLSLVREFLDVTETAALRIRPDPDLFPYAMKLNVARGCALLYVRGSTQTTREALAQGLAQSKHLSDGVAQVRALWALAVASVNAGLNEDALRYAEELTRVADGSGSSTDRLIACRARGAVHHVVGEQTRAQAELEEFFDGYEEPVSNSPTSRYHFDQRVAGLAFYARVLWLRNDTARALDVARQALERAVELDHTYSICHALAQASIPLALDQGHHEAAALYIQELADVSQASRLSVWLNWSHAYQACLDIRTGSLKSGIGRLQSVLSDSRAMPFSMYHCGLMSELAAGQLAGKDYAASLATLDAAIARAARTKEVWCLPDLMRLKGLALSGQGADVASTVLHTFDEARTLSERQGATLWRERLQATLRQSSA